MRLNIRNPRQSMAGGGRGGRGGGGGRGGKRRGHGGGDGGGGVPWNKAKMIASADFLKQMQTGSMDTTGRGGGTYAGRHESWNSNGIAGTAGFSVESYYSIEPALSRDDLAFFDISPNANMPEMPLTREQIMVLGRMFMETVNGAFQRDIGQRPHLAEAQAQHERHLERLEAGPEVGFSGFSLTQYLQWPEGTNAILKDESVAILTELERWVPAAILKRCRLRGIELYRTRDDTQRRADSLLGEGVRGVRGFYDRNRKLIVSSLEGDKHNFYHELGHSFDHELTNRDWESLAAEWPGGRPENFARGFAAWAIALRHKRDATFSRQYPRLTAILMRLGWVPTPMRGRAFFDAVEAFTAELESLAGTACFAGSEHGYDAAMSQAQAAIDRLAKDFRTFVQEKLADTRHKLTKAVGAEIASEALGDDFQEKAGDVIHHFSQTIEEAGDYLDTLLFGRDEKHQAIDQENYHQEFAKVMERLRNEGRGLERQVVKLCHDHLRNARMNLEEKLSQHDEQDRLHRMYADQRATKVRDEDEVASVNRHLHQSGSDWRLRQSAGGWKAYSDHGDYSAKRDLIQGRKDALESVIQEAEQDLADAGKHAMFLGNDHWKEQVRDYHGRWSSDGGGDGGASGPVSKAKAEELKSMIEAVPDRDEHGDLRDWIIDQPPAENVGKWLSDIKQHPYIKKAQELVDEARKKGATTGNLYWDPKAKGGKGDFTTERLQLHDSIAKRTLNPEAKAKPGEKPQVCFVIGPPASGKSTVGRPAGYKLMGMSPDRVTVLDPDEIKTELPEYRGWNAALVHDESAEVFDRILEKAVRDKHHCMFDTTGRDANFMLKMVNHFHKRGYDVSVVNNAVNSETAAFRAVRRFVGGAFNRDTTPARMGRYVPVDFVYHGVDGKPDRVYRTLKSDKRVKAYESWDLNDMDNPVKRESGRREER